MAELVNPTHRSALSQRNSEPSHLDGGDYEVLGGPGIDSVPGGDDYKIRVSGVTPDTTVPKSVPAEPSHLKQEEDDVDDLDVDFGDDDDVELDDLDRELDEFDDLEEPEVDVDLDEQDDEDDAPLKEEDGDDKKTDDDLDEEDEPAKDDDEPLKEEADEDDEKKDDLDEEDGDDDEKKPPFGKDKDDDNEKKVAESVKIRIKLPEANLLESAGLGARTQKKVGALFEAAIRQTTKQVATQLHAHYKQLHEQKIAKRDELMLKRVDSYLNYVVEEWMKANRVAVRQSLRAQFAEEFLDGLQKLFKEHYVDVPDSKRDLVKELTARNDKLRRSLNEKHTTAIKLRKLAEAANKARIVAESSREMSEASVTKLQKLVEDIPYTNAREFREKLAALKETYFPQSKTTLKPLPEETVTVPVEKKSKSSEYPEIDIVTNALARQASSDKW